MAEEKEAAGKKQETDKGKDAKEKTEAAAPGSSKTVFWGIIGGLVVLEIIIMYFVISLTRPKSAEEVAAAAAADSMKTSMQRTTEMGSTTKPVELVTNVAGTDGERFIKVAFVLEFTEPEGTKVKKGGGEGEGAKSKTEEELTRRMPKFKNLLIDLLSKQTLAQLNEPSTREMIRKDFMRDINGSLPPDAGRVTDVLFDQFVIQ